MGGRRLKFVYPLLQSCGMLSRTVGCTSFDLMDHPPLRCNAGRHLLASGRREPHWNLLRLRRDDGVVLLARFFTTINRMYHRARFGDAVLPAGVPGRSSSSFVMNDAGFRANWAAVARSPLIWTDVLVLALPFGCRPMLATTRRPTACSTSTMCSSEPLSLLIFMMISLSDAWAPYVS